MAMMSWGLAFTQREGDTMYKDVLQVMHVLATAILMMLAGQLKEMCLKILGGE
jgi:hypothetical protein